VQQTFINLQTTPKVNILSSIFIFFDHFILDTHAIQTFNLLDSLPDQARSSPKSYNPFAYIQFEHDYAIVTKQPVPVAKRLTVDGLHDMGVQVPTTNIPIPKFPPREHDVEMRIMYELDHGIDEEDMSYLKRSFQLYALN
jgi:hypothetical protein